MTESSHGDAAARVTGTDAARQKQLLMLVGAVALAVVVAVVYFVVIRGGSSTNASAGLPSGSSGHNAVPSASPSASTTADAAGVVPANYLAPAGHNPFKPLVVPPTQAAGGSGSTTTASSSASTTPSSSPSPTPTVIVLPTTTTSPSPTPTVTVTATPSPTGLPTAGAAITLKLDSVDVAGGTANVTVTDGTTSTPYTNLKPGKVFGTYFKLVSILSSDPANPPVQGGADFEYGDQFVQLSQGDSAQLG